MNKFFIVRHGQTTWNIEGKTQGHGDSKLTKDGENQARNLAKALKGEGIQYIYSSPLGRTVKTSQIIGDVLQKDIVYNDGLKEINFGKWEGLTLDQIKTDYSNVYDMWRNKPHEAIIPNAETLSCLRERLLNTINDLNNKHTNSNILLVSHGMSIKVLLLSLLGCELSNLYKIKQDNAAINIVEFKDYGPVITRMNDTNHIKGNKTAYKNL